MTPKWILSGNGLGLDDSGEISFPSAIEIWIAEFSRDETSLPVPSLSLPTIEFSPSVLSLRLAIVMDSGQPVLCLIPRSGDETDNIMSWPSRDQLIIGNSWYALDIEALSADRAGVGSHGIELGRALSVEQMMWLYWESGLGIAPLETTTALDVGSSNVQYAPSALHATLYAYQVQGAKYLDAMASQGLGVLLADEMGLGKTIQAIYLIAMEARRSSGPALVVCPSSLLSNWRRELDRFAPMLNVVTHAGLARSGDPTTFSAFDVVLTSYEVLVRDIYLLDALRWNLVVIDEAQAIKNPDTKRSMATKRLARRVAIAITGTPIENSLTDMWSIIEFVAPKYLGSLREFQRDYPDETTAARALSKLTAPIVVRREVRDVASDLPPRVDISTAIDVGELFVAEYETVRQDDRLSNLAKLTKLRQICASPQEVGAIGSYEKYVVALGILMEAFANNEKVLVFASFIEALDRIAIDLRDRLPSTFVRVLDGRMGGDDRQLAIDEFAAHKGPGVLVMNPKATGVGLNIQAASRVIHFTPEWNPAVIAQATARAHRRGQTRPVFVHYLWCAGTVEEAMMDRLEAKRALQAAGMSEITGEMNASDILDALSRKPLRMSSDGY